MSWRLWLDHVARDLGYRRRRGSRKTARRVKAPIGKRALQVDRLEQRTVLSADIPSIVDAFNLGRQQIQTADYAGMANTVLGTDIPVVDQTLAEVLGVDDLLEQGLGNLPTLAGNQTIEQIEQVLTQAGFVKEYGSLTPDGGLPNGDLLRYRYDTTINLPNNLFQFDLSDFEYFNDGVDGTVTGSLTTSSNPINVSVTIGVDIQDDVVQFFMKEGTIINTQGISFNGSSVNSRLAIRNLIDATVTGSITGGISATLGLSDGDADDKLRISQLANLVSLADGSVDANLAFDPTLTIKLPIVGTLPPIIGHLSATMIDSGTPSLTVNPFVGVDLGAYANSIVGSVQGAYSSIMSVIDIFGGPDDGSTSLVNGTSKLPVIDKSLFEVLGLPSFLTDAGLGSSGSGFTNNLVSDPVTTIQKLIQGEPVDLVKFQKSGGDDTSTSYSFPIAAAVVPIGPLPLTASLSFVAGASAAYAYYLGFGVDTTGFYVDANTSISGSGSVFAGVEAEIGLFSIVDVAVSAGVGGSLGARIGIHDPDRDGRIYLEEIVNDLDQGSGSVGDEILARMDASIFGEAYGFARGVVSFLFFDWTIFDERFTIAEFSEQLGGRSNPQDDATDYRSVYGTGPNQRFRPIGTGELSESLLDIGTGVLTLDASNTSINRASFSNSVSIEQTAEGLEVTWRGVGSRVYTGVSRVNFVGGSESDRFVVKGNTNVLVHAQGLGGADYLEAGGLTSTLHGGTGSDTLVGSVSGDTIYGEDGVDDIRGNNGADYIEGGDDGDIIDGGGASDTIHGQAGGDQINGGGDGDTIFGGDGIDVINGNGGDDLIEGGSGELATGPNGSKLVGNQISGGTGNDVIYGGSEPDVILGGLGEDFIEGQGGGDLIFGDNGEPTSGIGDNDTIKGQSGDDIIFGEGGNDTIYGDDSMAGTDGGNDLLSGDAGNDTIYGGTGQTNELGEGQDTVRGGDGNDSLLGNRGADEIYGGVGQDTLEGGAGNDRLYLDFEGVGSTAIDSLTGGVDQDMLVIAGKSQLMKTDPENPETWVFNDVVDDVMELRQTGPNNFEAHRYASVGGTVTDSMKFTLDGSTNGDIERLGIFGLGGNDTIYAAPNVLKNLTIDGGSGDDTLTGGEGRDSILGGFGNDVVDGMENDDVLEGGAGRDLVQGNVGNDVLYGGDETPVANEVDDTLNGGDGRDVIYAGAGNDLAAAGPGINGDLIYGGSGNDTLQGGDGKDYLFGEAGDDYLDGGNLSDILMGDAGNDTLVGGLGRDALLGGSENDQLFAYVQNFSAIEVSSTDNWTATYQLLLGREIEIMGIEQYLILREIDPQGPLGQALAQIFGSVSGILPPIEARISQLDTLIADLQALPDPTAAEMNLLASYELERSHLLPQAALLSDELALINALEDDLNARQTITIDFVDGGSGSDALHGSVYPDHLVGGEDNDTLFHSNGNDTISGGNGEDVYAFEATEGDDEITATLISYAGGNLTATAVINDVPMTGIKQIDIEAIGVYGRGGDDTMTVDFGNQATFKVFLDGGGDDDSITAHQAAGLPLQAQATLIGGSGDDTITGGLSDDLIIGGPDDNRDGFSDDVLSPLTDDDSLDGNAGNDTIRGGSGRDTITGNIGVDSIYGDAGNDSLLGGDGSDSIFGGDGLDLLDGQEGNDTLLGQMDNDTLTGGAGNDWLYGNEDSLAAGDGGIDTHAESADTDIYLEFFGNPSGTMRLRGGFVLGTDITLWLNNAIIIGGPSANSIDASQYPSPVTIYGGGGNDTLIGSPEADNIYGEDGADQIEGFAGNDIIFGGLGNDQLYGGLIATNNSLDGNDYINGENGNDTLDSGLGNDTIIGGLGSDSIDEYSYFASDSQNYMNYIFGDLGPEPNESIVLTEDGLDPYLHVGDSDPLLRGDIGQDFIIGGGGDDSQIFGGYAGGSDILFGGDGNDTIKGHGGDESNTFSGNDTFHGGGGADKILGADGVDVVYGGPDNDYIETFHGNDNVHGGTGNDSIFAGRGIDTIHGESGNDHIDEHTNNGTDWLNWIDAGAGDDYVRGDAGNDTIYGGSGDDTLSGGFDGPTNDIIYPGTGRNQVRNSEFDNYVNVWLNTPPIVTTAPIVSATEGVDWIFAVTGSYDPDGDPLVNYSIEINFEGDRRTFSSSTSTITVPWSAIADVADGGRTWAATISVQDENYEYNGTGTAGVTIDAANVEPSVSIAAPISSVRSEPVSFALSAIDPSGVDQAAGFMFEIDWDNNGIFDETLNGLNGLIVSHAFDTSGSKTVKVRTTDKDGGVSQMASHLIEVQNWALRVDPQDASKTDLHWGGSTGNDHYLFESIDPNTVQVRDGQTNAILQTFSTVTGKIYAYAGKGIDTLVGSVRGDYLNGGADADTIYGDVISPAQGAVYGSDTIVGGEGDDILYGDGDGGEGAADVIYGDAGNDTIFGDGNLGDATGADTIFGGVGNDTITADPDGGEGAADSVQGEAGDDFIKAGGGNDVVLGGDDNDILLGGDGAEGGNDSLDGGDGRDIIVGDGGSETVKSKVGGADTLRGSVGQDIVIAGLGLPTAVNPLDFIAVRAEWTSSRTLAERIANITGTGTGTRDNGNNFLTPGTTIYNDKPVAGGAALVDQVFGGADEDWIFADVPEDAEADLEASDILVDLSLFPRPE